MDDSDDNGSVSEAGGMADQAALRDILNQIQGQIPRVDDAAFLVRLAGRLRIPAVGVDDPTQLKVLLFTHLLDATQFAGAPDIMDELYDIYESIVGHLNPDDEVPVVANDRRRGSVGRGRGRGGDDDQRSHAGSVLGRGRGRGLGVGGGYGGYGWFDNHYSGPPDIVGGRGRGFGVGRGTTGFPGVGRGRGVGVKAAQSSLFGNIHTSTPNRKNPTTAGQGGHPGGGGGNVIRRLRDFKIHGQIGTPGQADKLTYSNLAHQVVAGRHQGYEPPEIIAAIIRAVVPGLDLRSYLEGRHDWDLPSIMVILRTHFKEKDATAVFTEMGNASQGPDDTEHAFCMRMMGLRDKVMMLTWEEGGFYDDRLVQAQFQHALYTGLRNEDARHNLRPILRQHGLLDEDLLVAVNEYMMNSVEHNTKTNGSSNAAVSSLHSSGGGSGSRTSNKAANKEKESSLMVKMDNTADQVNVLSARLNELTTLVTNHVVAGANTGGASGVGAPGVGAPGVGAPGVGAAGAQGGGAPTGPGGQTINGFAVGNQNGQEGFFIPFAAFGGGGSQPRRRGLCPVCVAAGATQCSHCFKCKQTGHQKSDCPN